MHSRMFSQHWRRPVVKCMGWRGKECSDCIHLARSEEDELLVKISEGDVNGYEGKDRPRVCPRYERDEGRIE